MENNSQLDKNYYNQKILQFNENKEIIQIDDCQHYKKIKSLLHKNNATKSTAKKLGEFIADANNDLKLLIVGDNQTEKSKFINGLLNRNLLPTNNVKGSFINTIIRYGEEEKVTAYFFDGQIANFSTNQIELFTISDAFSSQIMREGLDYLEITITNEFLKTVTLFDTPSYRKSVFIKDSFLNRCQLVLWLTTKQFRGLPSERALVKTMERKKSRLLFLIEQESTESALTTSEFFQNFERLRIGIKDLEIAQRMNDLALFQNSNFDQLLLYFKNARLTHEEQEKLKTDNFLKWVDRFILELKSICERAPYSEAYRLLKEFQQQEKEYKLQKNELHKKTVKLDADYEEVYAKYNALKTGHQLVEFLKYFNGFEDRRVTQFIQQYKDYEKQIHMLKKNNGSSEEIQQLIIEAKSKFEDVKNQIFNVVQQKLIETEKMIIETNSISEYIKLRLDRATRKLEGFDPIVEAKAEILTKLNLITNRDVSEWVSRMNAIELNYQKYVDFYMKQLDEQQFELAKNEKHGVYKEVLETLGLNIFN